MLRARQVGPCRRTISCPGSEWRGCCEPGPFYFAWGCFRDFVSGPCDAHFARKRYNSIPRGAACNEDLLSTEDSQGEENRFRRSPTGPAVARPRIPAAQAPPPPVQPPRRRQHFWSIAIFVLLVSGVLIRAYRDLSQPEAWDYWKDQYVSPSLTSQVIDTLHLDGSSQGRRALFVSGTIGPAAAN